MRIKPWVQIVIALFAAATVGALINRFCAVTHHPHVELNSFGNGVVNVCAYIGELFLKALKMIIVPLIFTSIVVGIASLGNTKGFGRLGMKTLGYYVLSSFFAILIGLTMVNVFKPGLKDGAPHPGIALALQENEEAYEAQAQSKLVGQDTKGWSAVADIFRRMVPQNIFQVFSDNGQMLALIFVSLLTGFALIVVPADDRKTILETFEGLNVIVLKVTDWVMLMAPIGVFGLVAKTVALTGLPIFALLGKYFFVVLGSLAIHFLVVLPLLLLLVARVKPLRHFYAMRNALLTAFSTASSSATLPVTMRAVHEGAGVSNRVTSFTLPLGATVNMDGTALYECVAVLFVSQVLGYDLSLAQQFLVVVLALATSIGVAGVPSASLVAITIIIHNVGIANAGAAIGMLLAVDRLLDMSRTAVNVFSDSCGAVVIGRSEGETGILQEPIGSAGDGGEPKSATP